jgi:hypothetical protein
VSTRAAIAAVLRCCLHDAIASALLFFGQTAAGALLVLLGLALKLDENAAERAADKVLPGC